MASLLCDLHFWTLREDVQPKDTDHSTFKYYDKSQHKTILERAYGQDKLSFAQGRSQMTLVESKRLKSSIREMEEILAEQSVIFSTWRTSSFYQLVMASGLIINVHLNQMGDLYKITFDKYLMGKLLDYITDFAFTSKIIVVTYLESRVTLISFTKHLEFGDEAYESIAQGEPKLQVIDLLGPPGRRLQRRISLSNDSGICLFWWFISGQEVYPWTPNLNEEDRANMILYSFKSREENTSFNARQII